MELYTLPDTLAHAETPMYLLALVFPPAAVVMVGKPWQAVISCCLTPLLWFPGVLHAFAVIAEHKADKRNDRLIQALEGKGRRSRRSRDEDDYRPAPTGNPFDFN